MLSQKKETTKFPKVDKPWWTHMKDPEHVVTIGWTHHEGIESWNITCAKVLEVFGLPGQRYYYRPLDTHMTFTFKNKKDAVLCRILLSEKL